MKFAVFSNIVRAITRRPLACLSLAIAVLVASCSSERLIEGLADDAKKKIALDYYQRFRDRDLIGLAQELDPSARNGSELKTFEEIRKIIPDEPPTSTNLAGFDVVMNGASRFTYQFGYPNGKWFLVDIGWHEVNGQRLLTRFFIQPLTDDLRRLHAFTFARAGVRHFAFLLGSAAIPLFIVFTLIACVRAKWPRRKWLWIIFVIFSAGKLELNWSTGEIDYGILHFLLGGAGFATSGPFSPWIFSVGFPLGAIAFWIFNDGRPIRATDNSRPLPPQND